MDVPILGQTVEPAVEEEQATVAGYVVVADLGEKPPTAERFMRDQLNVSGEDSTSVMLVLDEGRGNGEPVVFMNAGICRDHGMLQWRDRSGFWVPSERHNKERQGFIRFRHPTGVTVPLTAQMKCSLALLYEAIDEMLRSRARPTCVEWTSMIR